MRSSSGRSSSHRRHADGKLLPVGFTDLAELIAPFQANGSLLRVNDHVRARIAAYRAAYWSGTVPDDAVTSSGSGLDPDISLANALRQAPSVAAARYVPLVMVRDLVQHLAAHRLFGVIGTDHVNVLKLNLALRGRKAR